jgi:hypothetical protein
MKLVHIVLNCNNTRVARFCRTFEDAKEVAINYAKLESGAAFAVYRLVGTAQVETCPVRWEKAE